MATPSLNENEHVIISFLYGLSPVVSISNANSSTLFNKLYTLSISSVNRYFVGICEYLSSATLKLFFISDCIAYKFFITLKDAFGAKVGITLYLSFLNTYPRTSDNLIPPKKYFAAIAPKATITLGFITFISFSNSLEHVFISVILGFAPPLVLHLTNIVT